MNTKHMMAAFACAAALCGSVQAAEEEKAQGWNWAMGEGVTFNEQSIVSAEVGLAFDSKFLSYGLVDNNDPILTPSAALTFLDWITVSVEAIFDVTRYGERAGYGNRQWRYQELDPGIAIGHAFSSEDYEWLPTTVEFELGYMYEEHPDVVDDDTQFVNFSIGLPDLWIEPTFAYERDIDRDNGTYLNLELGHTFTVLEGKEEGDDDILTFRLSIAQGWGDKNRVSSYLTNVRIQDEEGENVPLDHCAFMDSSIKAEFDWTITDGVTLNAYVAYFDYLFDSAARDGAKAYEGTGSYTDSYNFIGGVSIAFAF